MKRLAIYFFWDQDGIVRDFVTFYINSLKEIATDVCVVVNGTLTEESYNKINKIASKVIIRKNVGFDVWAYKEAIENIGWEKIRCYDELVLCNYTCYGPIYPFAEMFDEMVKRDCDFWGAVKHPEQPNYLLANKKGYICEHIMSYFVVVRKRMLAAEEFQHYWTVIPPINTKTESTAFHETVFTKHFEDLGYVSDSFVDLQSYAVRCYNSSIILANDLLIKNRCPLVKRRAFFFPHYNSLLNISSAHQAAELMQFIKNSTEYDENLIWDDLLQTQQMSVLKNNMHLTHIIPHTQAEHTDILQGKKISFIIYIPKSFYLDLLWEYIVKTPEDSSVLLIFSDKEVGEYCISKSTEIPLIECRYVEINDDIALECMEACRDRLVEADYTCCILNINSIEQTLRISEEDYCRYIYSSLLQSEEYIKNIIAQFEEESRLGTIIPTQAEFSVYYSYSRAYYYSRMGICRGIFNRLNLKVPFDNDLYSNVASSFWIKNSTTLKLFELLDEDNRKEIIKKAKVFDLFYPMLVQECGYYTASATTTENACISLDNQHYMQARLTKALFQKMGRRTWRFSEIENYVKNANFNHVPSKPEILKMTFGFREILLLLLRYPKTKIAHIKNKKNKTNVINTSLMHLSIKEKRVILLFHSSINISGFYLKVNGKIYFTKKELVEKQTMVSEYVRSYGSHCAFFEIPLDDIFNQKIELLNNNSEKVVFRWTHGISFNALELKKLGLYCRISKGALIVQKKSKFCLSVLGTREYTLRDKLLFLFLMANRLHPLTIFSENHSAADNSFQLFKYALEKKEKSYFIVSDKVKQSETNANLRKHMIVHNSKQHCFAMLFTKRWVTSFSLRIELFPTNSVLKDIHYNMLPSEWIFIPHGMAVGDKTVSMLHQYLWDNPTKTFVSTKAERDAYANTYEFKNVAYLGAPRMDKWYKAEISDNKIFIFFTWRLCLSKLYKKSSLDAFAQTDYFKVITQMVKEVRSNFPDLGIYYVFHHEIVKNNYHALIEKALSDCNINFIYLNSADGAEHFNMQFKSAKYLITDYSSVAFDFAYKNGAIPIYYLPEKFVEGHYTLQPIFYQIHLGVLTTNLHELIDVLTLNKPTEEMKKRKNDFYNYLDGSNSERVYNAIFKEKSLALVENTPVNKSVKRLGIYFFYDNDGVVDDYVIYYLEQLKPFCEQCVVVNGALTDISRKKLELICDNLLLRENIGFDSWAYKEALEYYGYDNIADHYDEVLLNNFTNFGPVFPFSEMFKEMEKRECDFWGHNRYKEHDAYIGDTKIVDHLQSYFVVFRKTILSSESFRKYWDTLQLPLSYSQAVAYHELRFTKYFEELGYVSDAYIPWRKYEFCLNNTPVYMAYSQMVKDRSPLLKRKVLYINGDNFQFPLKEKHSVYDLIKFIKQNTGYDVKLILQNLERTQEIHISKGTEKPTRRYRVMSLLNCFRSRVKKMDLYSKKNRPFNSEKFLKLFE